jgi:hypothetical protein
MPTQTKKPSSKRKTRKTKQSNTRVKPLPCVVVDEYFDPISYKRTPMTDVSLKRLGQALVQWALNDDDALTIRQFFDARGIGGSAIGKWQERCPKFRAAYKLAMSAIGTRREIGGIKKKFDSNFVSSSMAHYLKEYKALAEWRSALRQKEETKNDTKVVVIERYPSTSEVPHKKEKDVKE